MASSESVALKSFRSLHHGQLTESSSENLSNISSSCHVNSKKNSKCRPFFGYCFAIGSSFVQVAMKLFVKLCTVIPVFEIGILRFLIQLVIAIPLLIRSNDNIVFSPRITFFLLLRGFTGATSTLTRFYAVQNMPLGDSIVLSFTGPIFVAIFARLFLKEPLHRIYIFLLLPCLAGVILIARPIFIFGHLDESPEYENIWLPSLVAMGSAIFGACSMVLVRLLVGRYSIKSSVIIFYHGFVGVIYSVCGSYFDRGFQFPFCKSIDYLLIIFAGICGYLLQVTLNAALRFEKAFTVALCRTSGIIFGFIVQVLVFSLIPSGLSFGGAALITVCNLVIFIFKWQQYKKMKI